MPKRKIVAAASAGTRLQAARRWLEAKLAESVEVLVLAPSRGAADEFLRRVCPPGGGLFGVHRATPLQLAAELATPGMARAGLAPVAGLGLEALAARAISICGTRDELKYFAPVAEAPGMARALVTTLRELRASAVDIGALAATGRPGADLRRLMESYQSELEQWSLVDDAGLFALAHDQTSGGDHLLLDLPLLMLDLELAWPAERRFLASVVGRSPAAFATVIRGDDEGARALEEILQVSVGAPDDEMPDDEMPAADHLQLLRRRVFSTSPEDTSAEATDTAADGSFSFFSAAGEGRECVEIARRIQALAARDIGFDRMAILLRDPDAYLPLVEEALRRAGVPAFFTRGTIRPHPAGRALLALLDCAVEGLSASRFAEYLSLGQVPAVDDAGAPPEVEVPWVAAEGDQLVFKTLMPLPAAGDPGTAAEGRESPVGNSSESTASPVFTGTAHGTLHAPRGWESLLVDARVIGGRERWRQRLRGLEAELRLRIRGLAGEEQAREDHLRAQIERLGYLERFALPVIDALDRLPSSAPWGDWLEALEKLSSRALKEPEKVLTLLAELRPMDRVGPVGLDEVRRVLGERLSFLRLEPAERRYCKVFVATIAEARGRSFEAIFLPGLAEGIFPRRTLEDPLLLDVYRRRLSAELSTQDLRVRRERLLLRIAAGAARSQLIVSYPNLDVLQGRPRVPSFYALDLLRAAEGRIPELSRLEARATAGSQSLLGWPAPRRSETAIDDAEYDLSVLEPMLRHGALERRGVTPEGGKSNAVESGGGRFLLRNPHLDRSLRSRYLRWKKNSSLTPADGVVDPDPATIEALACYRLDQRSYSPTALQNYAACPYRFLLNTMHGLKLRDQAVRLEQLDPLTRGSLFHQVQFELFQELEQRRLLSFDAGEERAVTELLAGAVERVAGSYYKDLAPAIERVWRSEIDSLHTDLRGWIRSLIDSREPWRPANFELGFGLGPASATVSDQALDEAPMADGKRLRGRVDLVEEHTERDLLRVTDHKTGKSPKIARLVVGGGKTLQPVLYGLAMESLLGRQVASGRLSFCTRKGRYTSLEVPLDDDSRRAATVVLDEIDRALETGFLPAAPGEGECRWCDYHLVCGPGEETRVRRKHPRRLVPLNRLRSMP